MVASSVRELRGSDVYDTLAGAFRNLMDEADKILNAWRAWSDPSCEVYAETDGTPHNTITPILRKVDDEYRLSLVLRNNRTSDEHPLGIFHPHAPLHHIKKENIGLIEVMGLFILPGRLKTELCALEDFLTGERPLVQPEENDMTAKHFDWIKSIVHEHGLCANHEAAAACLRSEVAKVCAQVLSDAGGYKQDEEGLEVAARLGRNMAWLVKAVAAAKDDAPAYAPRPMTNFIR